MSGVTFHVTEGQRQQMQQLARMIGQHLPDDRGEWEFRPDRERPAYWREGLMGFHLRCGIQKQHGRIQVTAVYATHLDRKLHETDHRRPVITVSYDAEPEQIARQIASRLLPPAEEVFADLQERNRDRNALEHEKQQACEQLIAASRGDLWHERRPYAYADGHYTHGLGRKGDRDIDTAGGYGYAAQVEHSTVTDRLTVTLSLSLNLDDALAVTRLLAARHEDDEEAIDEDRTDDNG